MAMGGAQAEGRLVALGWSHCPSCAAPAATYRLPHTGTCTACGRSWAVRTGFTHGSPVVETTDDHRFGRRWR
jgi:transposase-like protein